MVKICLSDSMSKKLLLVIIAIGVGNYFCKAQDSLQIAKDFRQIIKYIIEDSITQLAGLVSYPLIRPNPIPDISNSQEFIAYAPIMFDTVFRQRLSSYADSDIFERNGYFGLVGGQFAGEIWIDESGFVESINYHSAVELRLQLKMTREIQNKINPMVNMWKENILVCETKRFVIRIDYLDNNELRYVSWNKPKTMKDKPDLVLLKGIQEFQGSMGGVSYTFVNKTIFYQLDQVDMAESDDEAGFFLRIFKNKEDLSDGKPMYNYKCHELK
jgi:hypothetical protein